MLDTSASPQMVVVCWLQLSILCLFLYLHLLTFTGIYHCGETIIKEEGVRALWKGLTPFAVHLTLKYALRMGTNAMYQSVLRDEVCKLSHAVGHSLLLVCWLSYAIFHTQPACM